MIKLAENTFTKEDIQSICDWLQSDPMPRLTKGDLTLEYEKKYAEYVGTKYAVFCNSGSSANLLMIQALVSTNKLKNKKIVVPALSWITTISPVIQLGLEPLLVDCNFDDLSADLNQLEELFKYSQPAAFMLTSILGLVPDMGRITELCNQYKVILICDNCESQFSKFNGVSLEAFGVMSSCSSYFGHNSSTIEGGMVTTNDDQLYNVLLALRSHAWVRDIDPKVTKGLETYWDISGFSSQYTFYFTGFNLRSTEINAFLGLTQMNKYEAIQKLRNDNYKHYNKNILNKDWKPKQALNKFVCNLGYPVIHNKRDDIVNNLTINGIECRPLIAGNLGAQPFFIEGYGKKNMPNADFITKYGLYLPNHTKLKVIDIEYISGLVNSVINEN